MADNRRRSPALEVVRDREKCNLVRWAELMCQLEQLDRAFIDAQGRGIIDVYQLSGLAEDIRSMRETLVHAVPVE